jgi:putative nucleotidyltransferase with HDIG domain
MVCVPIYETQETKMPQNKIEKIESYVTKLMSTFVAPDLRIAHDFNHVDRVRRWAVRIARDEGVDSELVEAAALLHDIGLSSVGIDRRAQHAQVGAELAKTFLKEEGLFNDSEIEIIADAIRCHSSPSGGGMVGSVLRDADKLDALGAVGIMRAFMSKYATPEYGAQNPKGSTWQMTMGEFEQRFSQGQGIGEYVVDQVNFQVSFFGELSAETARQIGKPLVDFMKAYVVQLDSEIRATV